MIYFITNRTHQVVPNEGLKILDERNGKALMHAYMKKIVLQDDTVGIDTEASGLDAHTLTPLLLQIGDASERFVIDLTSVNPRDFLEVWSQRPTLKWLAHNYKYDYKLIKVHYGISLYNGWDTMIAEQQYTRNTGYRYGLDKVVERRLNIIGAYNKEERNEFIGMTKNSIFTNKQIIYAAGDLAHLKPLKEVIEKNIRKFDMTWYLENVQLPLISVLADMELEGWELDIPKWKENIEENKKVKFETEIKLDEKIRQERDKLPVQDRIKLVGGMYDRVRIRQEQKQQFDLFGEPIRFEDTYKGKAKKVKKYTANKGNINYKSPVQIVKILSKLKYRVPTINGEAYVPKIEGKKVLDPPKDKYSTKKDIIEPFILSNYGSKEHEFYKLLRVHRVADKKITSFGDNFIDKINPITKRIHSQYRQNFAINDRLQSGGGKKEPDKINNQNIPRLSSYRTCFRAGKGYKVVTSDLSGAEVTVMADKANDPRLLELNSQDIHSHMAQTGWRNIFLYRAGMMEGLWKDSRTFFNYKDKPIIQHKFQDIATVVDIDGGTDEERRVVDLYLESQNFVVSQKINKESHRTPCKNLTFGAVYGCKAKKAGKTINVLQEEGEIYIQTIKREIPSTFKMVEDNVQFAMTHGYLSFNKRSNDRVWFLDVLMELQAGRKPNKYDFHEVDGEARNIAISGTQANMVKEAMVVIAQRIRKEKWDCAILVQVHDELAVRFPEDMGEVKFTNDKGESKMVPFPEYIALTMTEVANRYLTNMKMKAEYEVGDTWIK